MIMRFFLSDLLQLFLLLLVAKTTITVSIFDSSPSSFF